MHEVVVGFDARHHSPDHEKRIHQQSKCLLKPEVTLVASVDNLVWPSAITRPPDRPFGLCGSLLEVLQGSPASLRDSITFIKISLFADLKYATVFKKQLDGYIKAEAEGLEHARSSTLGFDIADTGLISAVSDCVLDAAEILAMRRKFATSINEHGLFTLLADASRAKKKYEVLIPEHTPLYVFRLSRIELI